MTAAQVLDAYTTLNLDLQGIKLIEASAGTGKTYAIANLYLRYVLEGYRVSEILVVTFTNAATEELRGRIRQRLYETLRQIEQLLAVTADTRQGQLATVDDNFLRLFLGQLPTERADAAVALLKLAVRTMDEASIYTIHGFCQRALTDHAFNSGQAFQVELASDDGPLWTTALKDWWRRESYELDSVDCALFTRALESLQVFIHRQKPLRETRDTILLPEVDVSRPELFARHRALPSALQELAGQWRQRREELTSILIDSPALSRTQSNGYKRDELPLYFEELDRYFAAAAPDWKPEMLKLLCATNLAVNNTRAKSGTDPALADPFFNECRDLLASAREIEHRFAIRALLDATTFAWQQIEQIKQRTRTLSFNDQLTRLFDALQLEQGEALAGNLRQAFPVAMIDEFQDTDTIQYGIFRRLYFEAPGPLSLIMIGDPKQAIYSFRGGDIFTYIRARSDAGANLFTLDTNWRSVPALIDAVNTIFSARQDSFIYSEAIEFHPVKAAAKPDHETLQIEGMDAVPLTIWRLPNDDGKAMGKNRLEPLVHQSVASEIHRLVQLGRQGLASLGSEPVQPGHIAVLVRNISQGTGLREALQQRGINAVTVGRDRVFASEEAHGLLLLLSAVIHCSDRNLLRTALTSNLLHYRYEEMADVLDDEKNWLEWVEQMKLLNALWQRRGFMPMFQSLLQSLDLGRRVSSTENAERRMTNLLHLAELLQQSARTHPGREALLTWYRQQIEGAAEEEAELRMESDEALVKIITIHASKGLEYPIVFVPYLWSSRPCSIKDGPLAFHNRRNQSCLDLGSDQIEEHLVLAEKERLAEDVRLAYVALTRARARIYLAWGEAHAKSNSEKSALAWLLYHTQSALDLDTRTPSADLTEAGTLQKIIADAMGNIELLDMPDAAAGLLPIGKLALPGLAPAEFNGRIANDWRIASFSALTRDIHQTPHSGSARGGSDAILNFPAGSHVGLFLHSLLEELDFQQDIPPQAAALHGKHAARYGLDSDGSVDTVTTWLHNIVHTPLQGSGFTLATLPQQKRLNELAFDFAVESVSIQRLNQRLAQTAGTAINRLEADDFRGVVTGIIDLIFEHEGRFYIADYKSNFLGGQLSDYTPPKLQQAILDRRYDLQYLIYAVALQRYLRQRLRNYSFEAHFGGVYYLFVRGMRPDLGHSNGVFFDRPAQSLLDELDNELFAIPRVEREAVA